MVAHSEAESKAVEVVEVAHSAAEEGHSAAEENHSAGLEDHSEAEEEFVNVQHYPTYPPQLPSQHLLSDSGSE